jgi:5'-3' exonuclease
VDRPLLLVDTPSLYFRAYFGIPESAVKAPDGRPMNAVRGLLDMLAQLVRTRRPDRLICAFDHDWRPAWRVALIDTYKKHRVAPAGGEVIPDNLAPQVPIILEALAAFGIPALGAKDYEADDVLGTLATTRPGPVEVVSGDRDLFQLIDDDKPVRLLYCGKGIANLDVCDDAFVQTKYGVKASQYADFAALRGDPSDGLPGVAGVGEKTAARLIARYGSLAAIVDALDNPKADFAPGLRAKLAAAADYLAVAPEVVAVARDVDLPDVDATLPLDGPKDVNALLKLAEAYNVASAAKRLVDAIANVAQ